MKNKLRILIVISLIFSNKIVAQVDNYTVDFKFGIGRSNLSTFGNTNKLFSNQWGNKVFVGIGYKGVHLNAGIQGYNEGLNRAFDHDNFNIPQNSSFSNQYVDFNISYEHEIVNRFFIEPSIGYARVRAVTNLQYTNGDEFKLESINGFSSGVNFTKFVRFQRGFYLGPFINLSYDFINYASWNNELDKNSFRLSLGVVVKGTN